MPLIIRPSTQQLIGELRESAEFSYKACEAIINYLWDYSADIGEDLIFDPVAIRCDVNAYEWREVREYYSNIQAFREAKDEEELLEALQDHTTVIDSDSEGVVFFVF